MADHVLVVDDDPCLCQVLEAELTSLQYRVTVCTSAESALSRAALGDIGVILTDLKMPSMSGVELCAATVASGCGAPVVVMTACGTTESVMAAIRAGAYDYVTKPLQTTELTVTLERALSVRALREEAQRLQSVVDEATFHDMTGTCRQMTRTFDLVQRVAQSDATVLVTGESGTGKELVALAIHARSARAKGPFVAINCAAMPEALLESELFGHAKGAFTDARYATTGLFLKAMGGTLFLDEIGEMPLSMQGKLLRALQERTVRPVGVDVELPFDARVITATHRDLDADVAANRFRQDLFYRINVVCITLPPLRARGRDVMTIAQQTLRRCQLGRQRVIGFQRNAIEAMLAYPWPGNVRELQNAVQRAVAFADFDHISVHDLPDGIRDFKTVRRRGPAARFEIMTIAELERRHIARVLEATRGNKTVAARILGFDRRTLYRKLEDQAFAASTFAPSRKRFTAAATR